MQIAKQTSKQPFWKDEQGNNIPYNRTTPVERLMENKAFQLAKKSQSINEKLVDFKQEVVELCNEVYDRFMEENNNGSNKSAKGNFTFFNFERTIKIEVSVSERIEFDDLTIQACKDKLHEYIEINIQSKDGFGKELIDNAFSTTKGRLDAKKVMSLLAYRSKITNPLFQEALNLMEKSIRRPSSKKYFRVSALNEEGQFENIDLNFSSI